MYFADGISYEIYGAEILKGVSIEIEPGAVSVLVGPSGAGKTSLLKCLSMLALPSAGEISFEGKRFRFPLNGKKVNGGGRSEIDAPWPDVTAVFQEHFLWPHLSLRRNIEISMRLKGEEAKRTVDELVEVLGIGEFIERYPHEASVGQCQRVAIARALALKPRYVLFDEITSALDVEQSYAVFCHLMELKKRGIGILLITHNIDFAKSLLQENSGDTVYFMDEGKILERGGRELLSSPANSRVKGFVDKMVFAYGE